MGEEVEHQHFHKRDFEQFSRNLHAETQLLHKLFNQQRLSSQQANVGFELEVSLINAAALPEPRNDLLLETCNGADVSAELAMFNLEINTSPQSFSGNALSQVHTQLKQRWQLCENEARRSDMRLLLTGILPTLTPEHLNLENMSPLKRYLALNEQILRLRHGKPLHVDIDGKQHLISEHGNVMIEAATTSFQMHWQVAPATAHRYYNAMLIAAAPLIAASANSPLLFRKQLWQETRIPLFEQSLAVHNQEPGNRLPRVTFGSGYCQSSILECFDENINQYNVILPATVDSEPEEFQHLRLHNGTIWRWVRPIVGFDDDGTPHLRLEQRTTAAGPTLIDSVTNAALLFGMSHVLANSNNRPEHSLAFEHIRNNFYACARLGLQASIHWIDGKQYPIKDLFKQQLLPMAKEGLTSLAITDFEPYLNIMAERVTSGRNGAWWQVGHLKKHQSLAQLTNDYYTNQITDRPVHEWSL